MPPKKTNATWAKQANDEGLTKLSSFFKPVPEAPKKGRPKKSKAGGRPTTHHVEGIHHGLFCTLALCVLVILITDLYPNFLTATIFQGQAQARCFHRRDRGPALCFEVAKDLGCGN